MYALSFVARRTSIVLKPHYYVGVHKKLFDRLISSLHGGYILSIQERLPESLSELFCWFCW